MGRRKEMKIGHTRDGKMKDGKEIINIKRIYEKNKKL
jgi:hypothetical protein